MCWPCYFCTLIRDLVGTSKTEVMLCCVPDAGKGGWGVFFLCFLCHCSVAEILFGAGVKTQNGGFMILVPGSPVIAKSDMLNSPVVLF